MMIVQMGDGLSKICPYYANKIWTGQELKMTDMFEMIHPSMAICYTNIEHFMNAVFLLQIKKPETGDEDCACMVLKGISMTSIQHIPLGDFTTWFTES